MHEWCILRAVGESVQTVGYVWAADKTAAVVTLNETLPFLTSLAAIKSLSLTECRNRQNQSNDATPCVTRKI